MTWAPRGKVYVLFPLDLNLEAWGLELLVIILTLKIEPYSENSRTVEGKGLGPYVIIWAPGSRHTWKKHSFGIYIILF